MYDGPLFNSINKIEILYQITQGLQYLHALKIVHRDIKPRNILIFVPTAEGHEEERYIKPQIKLADFGLCKILNQRTNKEDCTHTSNELIKGSVECSQFQMMKLTGYNQKGFTNTSLTNPRGTKGWMAPELFEEERVDYFKVDIWALGCIFAYTMSRGKHPFGDDDKRIGRIRRKEPMVLVQEDFNKNRYLPPSTRFEAFELVKSMLDVDPTIRPTVDKVLQNPFFSSVMSVSFTDLLYNYK